MKANLQHAEKDGHDNNDNAGEENINFYPKHCLKVRSFAVGGQIQDRQKREVKDFQLSK